MNFILLTHENEFPKLTNTGKLVEQVLGGRRCLRICWKRKEPDNHLLDLIKAQEILLLFPQGEGYEVPWQPTEVIKFQTILLLDGTWQQARKMYRQSPYLHEIPYARLTETQETRYDLRRNQVEGGLCTAETVVASLELVGDSLTAGCLSQALDAFIDSHKKGRH